MGRALPVDGEAGMMRHLRKLKGKGLTELRERTVTAIYGVLEAAGFDAVTGRLPDGLSIREGVGDILAPAAFGPDESVEELKQAKDQSESIIRSADRILEGKFDLLGYEGLDFGKPLPDWHFDPVSGKRSPRVHWLRINEINADETGDKKVIWELNRHQYFITLGQAYLITADPKYAEAVWNHFDSWCRENPAKTGVNWLSSLELAFRAISWIRAFYLLDGSGIFTTERSEQLARMLFIHARHIERFLSTYFAPNTHLTGEAIGLYYIGTFLNAGKHSKRWRELGYRILCEQAEKHIREDGSYVEQASHYARYTADIYSDLVLIRRREGLDVPGEMIERLSALKQYLEALIRPDGTFIIFGDDDGGRYFPSDPPEIDHIGPTLARMSAATGIPVSDGPLNGENVLPSLIWSLSKAEREAVKEMTRTEPTMGLSAFRSGGLFAYRPPGGAEHFLFHAGPHGFLNCGHAHADAISFELPLAAIGCS
ncbi:MAG: hypothetical protein IPM21_16330 [Acidobacteria bacterium]|nr:hypothetical protein [Acidobacteriota bacterium]